MQKYTDKKVSVEKRCFNILLIIKNPVKCKMYHSSVSTKHTSYIILNVSFVWILALVLDITKKSGICTALVLSQYKNRCTKVWEQRKTVRQLFIGAAFHWSGFSSKRLFSEVAFHQTCNGGSFSSNLVKGCSLKEKNGSMPIHNSAWKQV